MKKIIGFAVTVFTVATLFAAARPSLDGRALVADAGTMPKGLFARTIGYLPGDSVAVTNPATGSTVDVLILGAIDPSEGVAILLSPEAADKLNITKDSNVQVKITKRAGSLDETVSGAAMLSESDEPYGDYEDIASTDEPGDENPVEEIGDNPALAETTAPVTPFVPTDESPAIAENPLEVIADESPADDYLADADGESETPVIIEYPGDAYTGDAVAVAPETEPAEEPVTIKSLLEDSTPSFVSENPVATGENNVDRIVFIEAPGEPAGDTVPAPQNEASDAYLDALADLIRPTAVPVDELPPADGVPTELFDENAPTVADDVPVEYIGDIAPAFEDVAKSEKITLEDIPAPADTTAELVMNDGDAIAETTEPSAEAEDPIAYTEPYTEPSAEAEDPIATEPTEVAAVVPADEPSDESEDGAYQPIILVPADENPPVAEAEPESEDTAEAAEAIALVPVAVESAPVASVVPETETVAPESANPPVASESAVVSANTDDYLVPTLQDLQSGSYYVQIASLGDKENIDELLARYAERYPMAVVPLKSGRAYQVMVGPLGIDEYTTVQERFKAYGFKDAFLRKIR